MQHVLNVRVVAGNPAIYPDNWAKCPLLFGQDKPTHKNLRACPDQPLPTLR